MTLNVRLELHAHALSNIGTGGSNRLLPRRQLLADGTETDAISGDIAKHYHSSIAAEYLEEAGVYLCPACAARDGRRAAAWCNAPDSDYSIENILRCGICDMHGFLVTAKKLPDGTYERERRFKHGLLDYPSHLQFLVTFMNLRNCLRG